MVVVTPRRRRTTSAGTVVPRRRLAETVAASVEPLRDLVLGLRFLPNARRHRRCLCFPRQCHRPIGAAVVPTMMNTTATNDDVDLPGHRDPRLDPTATTTTTIGWIRKIGPQNGGELHLPGADRSRNGPRLTTKTVSETEVHLKSFYQTPRCQQ